MLTGSPDSFGWHRQRLKQTAVQRIVGATVIAHPTANKLCAFVAVRMQEKNRGVYRPFRH